MMGIYTNLANESHTIEIYYRSSGELFLSKKCNSEKVAIQTLEEFKQFKNNNKKYKYIIKGPNLFLFES